MLRVLGVSAPHYVNKPTQDTSTHLNSLSPFSLYNAFRIAAEQSEGTDIYWRRSNWNNLCGRRDSIFMMEHFLNDRDGFIDKIKKVEPNLLFIGSMTLSLPGAIEVAKTAKELFGNNVFTVLGGKHVNETVFCENLEFVQLANSPLKLMEMARIPKVFDMVISGDGEEIIWQIGRAIGYSLDMNIPLCSVYGYSELKGAKGNWVIGWLDENMKPVFLKGDGQPLNNDGMLPINSLFPITSKFSVFDADLTAHAMSYLSPGCVYDCSYCSERCSINGKMRQKDTAPMRLHNEFKVISSVGKSMNKVSRMSAFVEDSILLGGIPELLNTFSVLLDAEPIDLKWGCQLTTDKLMDKNIQDVVKKLSTQGLSYLFVGIETGDEAIASSLSKSNSSNTHNWMQKNESVIKFVSDLQIAYGVSLLFGLGETHESRIHLMNTIIDWNRKYSSPNVISMNFAVQHPLRKFETYDYVEWGTASDSEYLKLFTLIFGEASEKYGIPNVALPSVTEFGELYAIYRQFVAQSNR